MTPTKEIIIYKNQELTKPTFLLHIFLIHSVLLLQVLMLFSFVFVKSLIRPT